MAGLYEGRQWQNTGESDGWGEAREECPGSWLGHVGRWWVVSFTYTGPHRSLRLGKMWSLIFVYIEPAVSMGHQMAIPDVGGMEPRASHPGMVAQGAQGVKEDK